MNYTDNECPVCHRKFTDDDDVVVCPDCGTPHHRDCWNTLQHCANAQLHGSDFAYVNPITPRERYTDNADAAEPRIRIRAVRCPQCGGMNTRGSDRCEHCGANLENDPRRVAPGIGALNTDIIPPNVVIDGIPADEEAAYIGMGSTGYIYRFLAMDRRQTKMSWNWGGAIFGPLWLFYRKMYKTGLLYIVLSLLVAVACIPQGFGDFIRSFAALYAQAPDYYTLMAFIQDHMPAINYWQYYLFTGFSFAVRILLAFFGDYLYRRKVSSSILNIRTQASNMEQYMYLLRRKGGTSVLMPFLFLLYYVYIQTAVITGIALLLGR